MKLAIVKGSTSVTIQVFIQDSSSTTGGGLTGLVYNSAGLTCYYMRPRAAAAAVTLATQTVTGAYSSGGFVEISATNAPGWYRLDLPDAVVASGVDSVGVHLKGATNMAPLPLEIQLTSVNLNDSVRGGMTALPNAAAEAAGGLYTRGTGAGQIAQDANGRINTNITAVNADTTAPANIANQFNGTGITGGTYPATQAQLTNIVAVGAATNIQAESYVLTTGTQSANTYTATAALDGIRHEHTDTAGALDLYYQFDIGPESSPVSVTDVGYLLGGNDTIGVYAYNWVSLAWDQIGSRGGSGAAVNTTDIYALYAAVHVGSGVNAGKVRIRFYAAAGLTTATLAIDQLFVSFSINRQTVGYANGAFWINTVSGVAGVVPYFNYTADNPGSTLNEAQTLTSAVPLTVYSVSNNSSITLSASFENSIMTGSGYTLAFGGQSLSGSQIIGGNVSGIATGASNVIFSRCTVNNSTLPICDIADSKIEGDITLGMAGEYHLHNSHCGNVSGIAIDFGAAVGDNQLLVHAWQGAIEFKNMGQLGTDIVHLAGDGELIINANCIGGTIKYQGAWEVADNSGGAVTLIADDNTTNNAAILVDTASIGVVKNAAFSNFEFLMVASADHITPKTGLTVSGARSIDGGAFSGITGVISEVSNGIYQVDFSAADTNGDVITYKFSATDADDTFVTIKTRA